MSHNLLEEEVGEGNGTGLAMLGVGILVVNFRIVLLSKLLWMPLLRLGGLLLLLVIIILLV